MHWKRAAVGLGALLAILGGPALAATANGTPQAATQPSMYVGIVASPPSGRSPLSCTLSAAGSCGPYYPDANRTFHIEIDGVTGSGVGTCQAIREPDGATFFPITVTSGGSSTVMYNWTVSSTLRASEDLEEGQAKVPYYVSCGATFSSVVYGSYTSGSITIKFTQ